MAHQLKFPRFTLHWVPHLSYLITLRGSTKPYYEIMSYLVQCNTCQKWYANQRGLLVHLKYCTERHTNQQDNGDHLFLDHNPLKSCYDQGEHRDPWAVYDNELDELSIEENLSGDDRGDSNDAE